jgi:hypothetical protein
MTRRIWAEIRRWRARSSRSSFQRTARPRSSSRARKGASMAVRMNCRRIPAISAIRLPLVVECCCGAGPAARRAGVTKGRRQATDNGRLDAKVPPRCPRMRQPAGHDFVFSPDEMGFAAAPSSAGSLEDARSAEGVRLGRPKKTRPRGPGLSLLQGVAGLRPPLPECRRPRCHPRLRPRAPPRSWPAAATSQGSAR